jgi:hypothetical protein
MPLSQTYRPRASIREILVKGTLIGLSGGLAEVVFIWIYMTFSGHEPAAIARAIAAAAHLGAATSTGIGVHMLLSLLLGIALMGVWQSVRGPHAKAASAYYFMAAALVVVWSFNFLVLLPSLSPGFPDLLPYPVTFASKLLFALVGAPLLGAAKSTFAGPVAPAPWTRF